MTNTDVALRVHDVHVWFNQGTPQQVHALRGASLELPAGAFATIVGSNGAGKSTLANVIGGGIRPSAGRVLIGTTDVTREPEYRRARYIARVFGDPLAGTVADMSIEDNVSMAMSRGRRRTMRPSSTGAKRERIREALAGLGLGLEDRLGQNVGLLSSGQRQSLTMAMASAMQPQILLLDEHLSALDPVTKQRLTELTVRVAESTNCITLMVTHSMEDAIRLGDHLLVMNEGRVVASFDGEEKRALTVPRLLARIQDAGGTVSDRSLLEAIQPQGSGRSIAADVENQNSVDN